MADEFKSDLTNSTRYQAILNRLSSGRFRSQRKGIVPLAQLHADLAYGKPLNITFLGDSTMSGVGTPAHTSGNPGGVDWDADTKAQQAMPYVLEGLLTNIYDVRTTSNLFIHNAGKPGMTVADALSTYFLGSYVIANPVYRTPNYLGIQLGLNDVEQMLYLDTGDAMIRDTIKLLKLAVARGIMPILMPADPSGQQHGLYGSGSLLRDNRVVDRFIARFMEMVADIVGCMFLDHVTMMKAALSHGVPTPSLSGQPGATVRPYELWDTTIGTPYLHGGEFWNRLKASAIATLMAPRVIRIQPGERRRLISLFSETTQRIPDSVGNLEPYSVRAPNGQGGYETVPNTDAVNDVSLMTSWIWCDGGEFTAVYRSKDGDGITSGRPTSEHPRVRHTSVWNNVSVNSRMPNSSWPEQSAIGGSAWVNGRRIDQPAKFFRLSPGLNALRFLSGTHNSERTLGYWDIMPANPQPASDALNGIGRLEAPFPGGVTTKRSVWAPESPILSNVMSLDVDTEQHILMAGLLPVGCGWIFAHNPRSGDGVHGDRAGMMLFRASTTALELRYCHTEGGGAATGKSNAIATISSNPVVSNPNNLPLATDYQKLRIRIVHSGTQWQLRVYGGWDSYVASTLQSPLVLSVDMAAASGGPMLPAMHGVVGGLYYDGVFASGAGRVCSLEECYLLRTPFA